MSNIVQPKARRAEDSKIWQNGQFEVCIFLKHCVSSLLVNSFTNHSASFHLHNGYMPKTVLNLQDACTVTTRNGLIL